jgi:hypothetical protein
MTVQVNAKNNVPNVVTHIISGVCTNPTSKWECGHMCKSSCSSFEVATQTANAAPKQT